MSRTPPKLLPFSQVLATMIKWIFLVVTLPLTFPARVKNAMEKTATPRLKIAFFLGLLSVVVYLIDLALFIICMFEVGKMLIWVFVALQCLAIVLFPESLIMFAKRLTHRKDES